MNVKIVKSKRRTISVEIKSDATVLVRAPRYATEKSIEKFLEEKRSWIEKNIKKMSETNVEKLSEDEVKKLSFEAETVISKRAEHFAEIMGVKYNKISVKAQTTRFGSCSSKGNLNFNFLLILCPEEVLDYVVIHELCHLKEMNHKREFWNLVETYCSTYKESKLWLKNNAHNLIAKIK